MALFPMSCVTSQRRKFYIPFPACEPVRWSLTCRAYAHAEMGSQDTGLWSAAHSELIVYVNESPYPALFIEETPHLWLGNVRGVLSLNELVITRHGQTTRGARSRRLRCDGVGS